MQRNPLKWFGEQTTTALSWLGLGASWTALRGVFNVSFMHRPAMSGTTVTYDLARSLYRNDNLRYQLGAGFVRPIIDLTVEYVGVPNVTSDARVDDDWLNECLHEHWAPQIQQVWRDALRDSKAIVRFRQPNLTNPLFTESDRMHGRIECIPPETIDLQFDPTDPDLVMSAMVNHWIQFDERSDEEKLTGVAPRWREHHIIETVTPEEYRFYDKTDNRELTAWRMVNRWRFVPMWPAYNEYDVALGGGQSDIEPVLPFIKAFHDVLEQTLAAHKYHSTPKAFFKIKDVFAFLKHNFPHVLDAQNQIIPGAKVELTGREMYLLNVEEDAGFIEAKSVLGDSKTLLEFLIDCICIAAEVPKWAILKDQGATDKDASVQPFEKKVARKRTNFEEFIVMLCKMSLVASGKKPTTMRCVWPTIRLSDLAAKAQALQQIVMALDVATLHRWMSDATAMSILASLFPEMQDPETEKAMAKTNYDPPVPAPAPASPTQGSQNGNKNGSAGKTAAKSAVTKATASKS